MTCHDLVSIRQPIVQQVGWQSLGKPMKMVAKRNCLLIACRLADQAAYTKKSIR